MKYRNIFSRSGVVLLLLAAVIGGSGLFLNSCKKPQTEKERIELTELRLTPDALNLDLSFLTESTLELEYVPNSVAEADKAVVWEIGGDNPDAISFDQATMTVTAVKEGVATITVRSVEFPSKTASCDVVVTKDKLTLNNVPDQITMKMGDEPQVYLAKIAPADANCEIVIEDETGVIAKEEGDFKPVNGLTLTVKPAAVGTAKVIYKLTKEGYDDQTYEKTVTVEAGDIRIAEYPETFTVQVGGAEVEIPFVVTPADATLEIKPATDSNGKFMVVQKEGKYYLKGSAPATDAKLVIKATKAHYNSAEVEIPVTVISAEAVAITLAQAELLFSGKDQYVDFEYTVTPADAAVTVTAKTNNIVTLGTPANGKVKITASVDNGEVEVEFSASKNGKSDKKTLKVKVDKNSIQRKTITIGGASFVMVYVEPGTFKMGSPSTEGNRFDDETQHEVTFTKGYWISETEVSVKVWTAVTGGKPTNMNRYNTNQEWPVIQLQWDDVDVSKVGGFMSTLNSKGMALQGLKFRLPTEAEWEYAARGGKYGTQSYQLYSGSNNIKEVALFASMDVNDIVKQPREVNSGTPNALGLKNMTGNVWEWCSDAYDANYYTNPAAKTDPKGPTTTGNDNRVMRGGSWIVPEYLCRVAYRNYDTKTFYDTYTGVRLAADAQ